MSFESPNQDSKGIDVLLTSKFIQKATIYKLLLTFNTTYKFKTYVEVVS